MLDQTPYECRMEWGIRGAREAAERGDIIVIVDVLSFSSTVVTAVYHGAILYPYPSRVDAAEYARAHKAELLLSRAEAARSGTPSLSPVSFGPAHKGRRYMMSSLNGAACVWAARQSKAIFAGCLLNAEAVAVAANSVRFAGCGNTAITVIACGEHWGESRDGENALRPALEDYLGAGAIVSRLSGSLSPEAQLCAMAYSTAQNSGDLSELIWECGSGRELRSLGFADDITHSACLNVYDIAPRLRDGCFSLI